MDNTLMKKAADFLRAIGRSDNVVIVFNNDGDGICSCALVMKLLERVANEPLIIPQPMPVDKNLMQKIQTTVPDKIIFLDLAMDQQEDVIKKASGFGKTLVIDHHSLHKDLNGKRVVHYNPRFAKPGIYQSASYCTYKICSLVAPMDEYLWIASVGAVADYDLSGSKDLVEAVSKRYGIKGNLYDSFLGRYADMISATLAANAMPCERVVKLLAGIEDAEQPGAAIEEMRAAHRAVSGELSLVFGDIESHLEREGSVIFYRSESRYAIRSSISTRLGEMYPDKLVVVWEQKDSKIKMSSRNQSGRFNAGRLLGEAAKGLRGSVGGHDKAAGGIVAASDWDAFREKLVKLANKK